MIVRVLLVGAQFLGVLAALFGVYLLTGLAWSLVVGGAVLAALAVLAERAGIGTEPARGGGL
jgi:hypothetical protein